MDEIDIAKIQNYVDSKILAPMNIQEQKALCRIILELAKWKDDLHVIIEWARKHDPEIDKTVELWKQILESESNAE